MSLPGAYCTNKFTNTRKWYMAHHSVGFGIVSRARESWEILMSSTTHFDCSMCGGSMPTATKVIRRTPFELGHTKRCWNHTSLWPAQPDGWQRLEQTQHAFRSAKIQRDRSFQHRRFLSGTAPQRRTATWSTTRVPGGPIQNWSLVGQRFTNHPAASAVVLPAVASKAWLPLT